MSCAEASAWQQRFMKWKQRVGPQLRSGRLAACTFEVGVEPNIYILSAHKLVLSAASPVFESMFYGAIAEKSNNVRIPDIEPEIFKVMLDYIYTKDVDIQTYDMAYGLYYAATKYLLPELVKICSNYLESKMNIETACKTYEFAIIFDDHKLIQECKQIFKRHTLNVLNSTNFEEIELNTLNYIFSLDYLNINSEMDLFNAIERYAYSQEEYNTIVSNKRDTSVKESNDDVLIEVNPENTSQVDVEKKDPFKTTGDVPKKSEGMKVTIRDAVEKIRFLTMTLQQFVDGPAQSTLLTQTEVFAVLKNICSTKSNTPMPSGLSTERAPRYRYQ